MIHKFKFFFARLISRVREDGIKILYWKIFEAIKDFIQLLFSIPFVLLIRLLHPIKKVRFVRIDTGRIGHFDMANIYWARKKNGEFTSDIIDIVYFHKGTGYPLANVQYAKMWRRAFRIFPLIFGNFLSSIDKMNTYLPGQKTIYDDGNRIDQALGIVNNEITESIIRYEESFLSFTSDENSLGTKMLSELGIPENKQFICFHSRDSAYLETFKFKRDWSYHDFRDSSIYDYLPAVEEMVKRGYYAIRMGSKVKESLDIDNPKIIDYASHIQQSDFLDIYLSARSRFFILSDTGLSNPPEVFKKPIVYVNNFFYCLLCRLSVQNCIFIFKKIFLVREKRFLTFEEIAKRVFLTTHTGHELKREGIKVVDNTKDEIVAATIEMEKRLSGTWFPKKEDEELQARFWSLFPKGMSKSSSCRIGAQFLRDNRELLMFPSNSRMVENSNTLQVT